MLSNPKSRQFRFNSNQAEIFCGKCSRWLSLEAFKGDFPQRGNICGDCRVKTKMPLNSKIRFAVLNRDGFSCRYCGAIAPTVKLQVDHIKPVSEGGTNEMQNLITSCQLCNRGKSNWLVPESDLKDFVPPGRGRPPKKGK